MVTLTLSPEALEISTGIVRSRFTPGRAAKRYGSLMRAHTLEPAQNAASSASSPLKTDESQGPAPGRL